MKKTFFALTSTLLLATVLTGCGTTQIGESVVKAEVQKVAETSKEVTTKSEFNSEIIATVNENIRALREGSAYQYLETVELPNKDAQAKQEELISLFSKYDLTYTIEDIKVIDFDDKAKTAKVELILITEDSKDSDYKDNKSVIVEALKYSDFEQKWLIFNQEIKKVTYLK